MSRPVLDWLPLGVVAREPIRARVTAAVSAWSEAWFAGRRLHATRLAPVRDSEAGAQGGDWLTPRYAVALRCPKRSATRLLDWALDANVQRLSPSDADRKLIDAFETDLLADLAARIETALGISLKSGVTDETPYGPLGGLSIEVADQQGDILIWLAVPLGDLLPACKSSLPTARRATEKLANLHSAIADAPVSIEAILGSAKLGLADLQTLAPGDVLVLDAALTDTAALGLAGSNQPVARAALTPTEDALALTIQA